MFERILQYLAAAVPALIVVAVAAFLLSRATRGLLRSSWLAVSALSVGCIAIPPVATFIVLVAAFGVYDLAAMGTAALASSLAAGLLLTLLLRSRAGAEAAGLLLWPAVIAAEISFMVKLNSGGWIALGELIWGVYFAVPVIHVLVRMV